MQALETVVKKSDDWKARYKKLYSLQMQKPEKYEPERISFMKDSSTPYTSLLVKLRTNSINSSKNVDDPTKSNESRNTSLTLHQLNDVNNRQSSLKSNSLGVNDTYLLDLVWARNREIEDEVPDTKPTQVRIEDAENQPPDYCHHGLGSRTERSVSRSRFSRMSTRRDMDIPSILAFNVTDTAPIHLEIPAFQKIETLQPEIFRWSIRRSVCPVCSQKWRDKSSILNIKSSGFKRNSSELPSIIAPARIRTAVTTGYKPPVLEPAVESNTSVFKVGMRNSSGSWQLTRARRLRMPKPQIPSPDTVTPPNCRPTAKKDLDLRIAKFLSV